MDLAGSWDYIEQVAAERLRNNKTAHHVSLYGPEIETQGAAGELAARRFLGLSEQLHTHFDGGADILLNGYTIDVKTTVLTPKIGFRYLQWPHWKPLFAQIVLMTAVDMQQRSCVVIGYATKAELLRAPVNRRRDFPCREIPVRDLHPASDLLTLQHRRTQAGAHRRQRSQAPG